MFYKQEKFHIHESLNSKFLYTQHKAFLNRLFLNKDSLQIVFENVKMQRNYYNWGVLAIAFATTFIFYICPCLLNFKTKFGSNVCWKYDISISILAKWTDDIFLVVLWTIQIRSFCAVGGRVGRSGPHVW